MYRYRYKNLQEKLKFSEPYRFFLSTVAQQHRTHDETLSLSFSDLLSDELGVIEESLQMTFLVDIDWLSTQYALSNSETKPLTLLYGMENPQLENSSDYGDFSHLHFACIKPEKYGTHHTKMMILSYTDKSIRVIITTGNLVEREWENTTQGIWISPRLRKIKPKNGKRFDSDTNFKKDLIDYLQAYNPEDTFDVLRPWINKVKNADFREVKVFLLASAPTSESPHVKWGLSKMCNLLQNTAFIPTRRSWEWPIYCQCSSIGSMGGNPGDWLLGIFRTELSCSRDRFGVRPPVKVIYPCVDDVRSSYDEEVAGDLLTFSPNNYSRQPWLERFMCKWRSNGRYRTRAIPHIKTYCRVSPDRKFLSWFLLTSANLSKPAWGYYYKSQLITLSYEVGVFFAPPVLIGKKYFSLDDDDESFPLPYDVDLTPYEDDDAPWINSGGF